MSEEEWASLKMDFHQRLKEMDLLLKTWIADIQAIDIVTATAVTESGIKVNIDPTQGSLLTSLENNAEISIRGRTTLQLDGDYIGILPTKKTDPSSTATQVDNEMLALHNENVKFAMENYSNNIKIMTDGLIKLITAVKDTGIIKI